MGKGGLSQQWSVECYDCDKKIVVPGHTKQSAFTNVLEMGWDNCLVDADEENDGELAYRRLVCPACRTKYKG